MLVQSIQRLAQLMEDDDYILLEGSRVRREPTMRLLGLLFDKRMAFSLPRISGNLQRMLVSGRATSIVKPHTSL